MIGTPRQYKNHTGEPYTVNRTIEYIAVLIHFAAVNNIHNGFTAMFSNSHYSFEVSRKMNIQSGPWNKSLLVSESHGFYAVP